MDRAADTVKHGNRRLLGDRRLPQSHTGLDTGLLSRYCLRHWWEANMIPPNFSGSISPFPSFFGNTQTLHSILQDYVRYVVKVYE
jgi:hypothetical protein